MPTKPPRKGGLTAAIASKVKRALKKESGAVLPYPPKLLKAAEARAAYVAVYVVGPRHQQWPIAFGVTSDPSATYHSFQKGWWEEHAIHDLQWTAGRPAADRVRRAMVDMLGHHRKFFWRGWYDVTVDEARIALLAAARQEGVALFDDVEKERRLHRIAQKAWETKMGVESTQDLPQHSAVILPLRPPRKG